jgi:ERCC4-related helicase
MATKNPIDPSAKEPVKRGSDLFIVDNSDDQWKVQRYLHDWCEIAKAFDIATGYFEVGALLGLDGEWQKLDKIRILMGDEVSLRTQQAFRQALSGIAERLDESIESEKEKNDFLEGVPAIVEALKSGKIECKVYKERKFHAKAYITHARMDVVGPVALVGSSNFTFPGLTDNVELNVRVRHDVEELQAWYEQYWSEAEDVTPDLLRVFERHTRKFTPFEVYTKALYQFFEGHQMTASEWERTQSVIYPILDHYQREGYHALIKMAEQYNGGLLCDSVGLGKTFIGLMLIERLLFDRKRIALFVPKAARSPVWEAKLNKYLPGASGVFSNLVIYNHTDLLRESEEYPQAMIDIAEKADVIIIDEAHHFRNQGTRSYRKLFDMLANKQVFLLTATPINNSTLDLQHLIELFSRRLPDYFRRVGVHSLIGHFRELEKALQKLIGSANVDISLRDAELVLANDTLFRELVVQRSRAYARRSQQQFGGAQVIFPIREAPKVAHYSLKKTYGRLLAELEKAFNKQKPLLSLAIYYPMNYRSTTQLSIDSKTGRELDFEIGRQSQIVQLVKVQLLKRFESSTWAFQSTCAGLLQKLLAWVEVHTESAADKRRLERWKLQNEEALRRASAIRNRNEDEEVDDDASLPQELIEAVEKLSRKQFDVDEIINETYLDMEQLITFLNELRDVRSEQDDKLQTLVQLLKNDPLLSRHKVLIFSEYKDTARYLYRELKSRGIKQIAEVDSGSGGDRGTAITAFAPYYNDSSSVQLSEKGVPETRVLISTDVLSEGLNLQDASLMINYDLHWNPVRLMQRIGRVDRRLDPMAEALLTADHPEECDQRGRVHFWNFLPPDELDDLLNLYTRVAHKTLRISKIFGIEGSKLLTPHDDYEALKEFNQVYEGEVSPTEEMRLALRDLLNQYPGLESELQGMPLRVFSGRSHPARDSSAIFFCYQMPGTDASGEWRLETGSAHWFLYDLCQDKIIEQPEQINLLIRSKPDTPRHCSLPQPTLTEIRKKVDAHIKNTYLRSRQAPVGVKPVLIAWMELN